MWTILHCGLLEQYGHFLGQGASDEKETVAYQVADRVQAFIYGMDGGSGLGDFSSCCVVCIRFLPSIAPRGLIAWRVCCASRKSHGRVASGDGATAATNTAPSGRL